ncbi:MAG: TolC family protein [Gallionella sp.]|nr:TolC family protein [Gallionella sp.]
MPHHLHRHIVYTLLGLCCGSAMAGEGLDPFDTGSLTKRPVLSPSKRPALRAEDTVGDPCAEAMPNGALNLLEVVNLALCNNPQTREVWANSRAQAAQVGVSKAGYLPSVSLDASDNRIKTGNTPRVEQRNVGVTLSYLLYDFGSRAANLENSRQLLAAASATQDSTVQAIFLAAVQAFYQTQAANAALDAAIESESAAKESMAAAEARYSTGSSTLADKLQARTAYSQTTLDRITADGNLKNARGTLANMLGLDANLNVPLVAAGEFPASRSSSPAISSQVRGGEGTPLPSREMGEGESLDIFERDITELIEEARQRRPDLQAAAAQVRAAEASADAARAADRPTISLIASADQNNIAGASSRGSTIGINLNVPIFSGFAPAYRVRVAEAQTDARNARFEQLRLQVALDVWTAYQRLTTATQSLRTTADLLNSAGQSGDVALGRYKAGVGSMLDVLNAQSALANARQQRIRSNFDWNVSRAALAQAMGSLDTSLLQTLPDASGQNPGDTPPQKNGQKNDQ